MKCNVQAKALIQFLLKDGAPQTYTRTLRYPERKMDLPASCGLAETSKPDWRRDATSPAPARSGKISASEMRPAQHREMRSALMQTRPKPATSRRGAVVPHTRSDNHCPPLAGGASFRHSPPDWTRGSHATRGGLPNGWGRTCSARPPLIGWSFEPKRRRLHPRPQLWPRA